MMRSGQSESEQEESDKDSVSKPSKKNGSASEEEEDSDKQEQEEEEEMQDADEDVAAGEDPEEVLPWAVPSLSGSDFESKEKRMTLIPINFLLGFKREKPNFHESNHYKKSRLKRNAQRLVYKELLRFNVDEQRLVYQTYTYW